MNVIGHQRPLAKAVTGQLKDYFDSMLNSRMEMELSTSLRGIFPQSCQVPSWKTTTFTRNISKSSLSCSVLKKKNICEIAALVPTGRSLSCRPPKTAHISGVKSSWTGGKNEVGWRATLTWTWQGITWNQHKNCRHHHGALVVPWWCHIRFHNVTDGKSGSHLHPPSIRMQWCY